MRVQHLAALLFSGLATASPLKCRGGAAPTTTTAPAATPTPTGGAGTGPNIDMVAAIQAIMPTSNSCSGADFPDECRTAEQAAPFITKACADLAPAECAGTVALMGLESVDMKFKHNVSPGRPGQGTANMMMVEFTKEYATSLFGADKVGSADPNAILAMVTPDEYNFGSAAWFLTTKCKDARTVLATGTDEGWAAYNKCIGVDGMLAGRLAYWTRAKKAFNL